MFLGKNKEILNMQFWKILEVLDTAVWETSIAHHLTHLIIFYDS